MTILYCGEDDYEFKKLDVWEEKTNHFVSEQIDKIFLWW